MELCTCCFNNVQMIKHSQGLIQCPICEMKFIVGKIIKVGEMSGNK